MTNRCTHQSMGLLHRQQLLQSIVHVLLRDPTSNPAVRSEQAATMLHPTKRGTARVA